MKTIIPSFIRRIDQLGRIVLPKPMRKKYHFEEGDSVNISIEDEAIVIRKTETGCVFCGNNDGTLSIFRGRAVCKNCMQALADKKS